jgi:hypothetical protein
MVLGFYFDLFLWYMIHDTRYMIHDTWCVGLKMFETDNNMEPMFPGIAADPEYYDLVRVVKFLYRKATPADKATVLTFSSKVRSFLLEEDAKDLNMGQEICSTYCQLIEALLGLPQEIRNKRS